VVSPIKPMLATPVTKKDLQRLAESRSWSCTQKCEGRRFLIEIKDGHLRSWTRSGRRQAIPDVLKKKFQLLPFGTFLLDGEWMSQQETLQLFDVVQVTMADRHIILPSNPYAERIEVLSELVKNLWPRDPNVQLLPRATSPDHKLRMVQWIEEHHGEGVVFRRLDAPYEFGHRSSGMVKIKYLKSADCFVSAIGVDGKENLELSVYSAGKPQVVGKVSRFVGDGDKAKIGSVVDVEYLSFSKSKRMIQPTNPRLRTDKFASGCSIDQFFPIDLKAVGVAK